MARKRESKAAARSVRSELLAVERRRQGRHSLAREVAGGRPNPHSAVVAALEAGDAVVFRSLDLPRGSLPEEQPDQYRGHWELGRDDSVTPLDQADLVARGWTFLPSRR